MAFFLSRFARISDPQAGIIPFELWGFQRELLGTFGDSQRIVVLKARQLGISTLSLALDIFWCWMFPGTQGVLICDTEGNKESFRVIIDRWFYGNIRFFC